MCNKGEQLHTHTHDRFTGLCLGLPGWAGTRRNIHPLTPHLLINHPYHLPPSTTNHSIILAQSMYIGNLSAQPLTMSSSAYLWVWSPLLHTPYTSSPNHYHPFATHVHTIVACFVVIATLCPLFLVSLNSLEHVGLGAAICDQLLELSESITMYVVQVSVCLCVYRCVCLSDR